MICQSKTFQKIHLTSKCFNIIVDILCGPYLCFTGMFPAEIAEPWEAGGEFSSHCPAITSQLGEIEFWQHSHKYHWQYLCSGHKCSRRAEQIQIQAQIALAIFVLS